MTRRPSIAFTVATLIAVFWLGGHEPAAAQVSFVEYEMRRGDTLIELSEDYLVRPAAYTEVARLNRIGNARRIPVGRRLRIPIPLLRTVPAEARVVQVRGEAVHERGGVAAATAIGQIVREGDLVSTGRNAFVRLALPDGGHVVLPSNSRARAARLRTVLLNGATLQDFRLETGRLESRVSPVRPGGGFTVGTPISVSAVRGTEFRTAYDPGLNRSGAEVIEGRVSVSHRDAEIVAEEGMGVATDAAGVRLAQLLPAPALERPDAVQSGESLLFQVRPVPGALRYRARLATDAGMVDAFAETESLPDQERLELTEIADGLYFVRVTAVSPEGLEGLADVYSVVRARNGVSGLAAAARGRNYLFRWEAEGEGPAMFRFQLREEGAAAPLIDESGLTDARFTVSALPRGRYVWRVQISRHRFGRLVETWSEPQSLGIGR